MSSRLRDRRQRPDLASSPCLCPSHRPACRSRAAEAAAEAKLTPGRQTAQEASSVSEVVIISVVL